MKDNQLVTVKSKTKNNCSVAVPIKTFTFGSGENQEQRTLTRSYVFSSFQAQIPFQWARTLVQKNPQEYRIDGFVWEPDGEVADVSVKEQKAGELANEYTLVCPIDGYLAKSRLTLSTHVRTVHPEEWAASDKKLATFLEKYSV